MIPLTKLLSHYSYSYTRTPGPYAVVVGLFAFMGLWALPAHAHKVNVFAYVEGEQVYVQGYFIDGKKAKNSTVTVYGDSEAPLADGVTNDEGEFVFTAPTQNMRIVLSAGQGHQAEYQLSAADLGLAEDAHTEAPSSGADPGSGTGGEQLGSRGISSLESVVKRAVAEAMLPLARELAELKERRNFSDIIGGLGFIIGILGIFAYFKSRKSA